MTNLKEIADPNWDPKVDFNIFLEYCRNHRKLTIFTKQQLHNWISYSNHVDMQTSELLYLWEECGFIKLHTNHKNMAIYSFTG